LASCDLVHAHRLADANSREVVMALARGGTALTYDNDDNLAMIQKEAEHYKVLGGLKAQRAHVATVKVAKLARTFTTTNEILAEVYRRSGVDRVEVIPNCLAYDIARRKVATTTSWSAGLQAKTTRSRLLA
jgi:hypothetical protein